MTHSKAERVLVRRETYSLNRELPVGLYYPAGFRFNRQMPAVILVGGNVNWSSNITLAELLACNGFVAVVPETLQMVKDDTPDQLVELLERMLAEADTLLIDANRLAIWTEGHPASLALQVAMDREAEFHGGLRAAVSCLTGDDICSEQFRL